MSASAHTRVDECATLTRYLPVFLLPSEIRQSQKVKDCMENYPMASASILGGANTIIPSEDELEKAHILLDASIAVERLTKRAETTALAVIAAEAIVAMALASVTAVAGKLDSDALETLLVAKKTAAITLRVAKADAEETLALAREVAKELLEEARRKSEGYA